MVAVAGLDATRFLTTTDPLERSITLAVARRALELDRDLDENRAVLIANKVGEVFGGK